MKGDINSKHSKSILFDLDGVLVDTKPIQFQSLKRALGEYCGLNVDSCEELTKDIKTIEKLRILAFQGKIKEEDIPAIYELKKKFAEEEFMNFEKDKGKIDLFQYLDLQNIKFGIVTNANKQSSKFLLQQLGLLEYVKVLVTNNDVVNAKPHPEPYIRAMMQIGGKYEHFTIFEDSAIGLAAAVATGTRVVLVSSPNQLTIDFVRKNINT